MKKRVLFVLSIFILTIVFLLAGVLASSVENNIPVQIQTTDASGNIITGTFTFTINISNSSTCSPVLYSNVTTRTTDVRGIVSYYLPDVNLDFDEQYWFCYYRDGVLKEASKAGRIPYAFRAKNVTLSGVEIDSNFNLGSYNFTTSGNVGIGTSSPSQKLEVNGLVFVNNTGSATSAYVQYSVSGGQTWQSGLRASTTDFRIIDVTNNKYPFKIETNTPDNTLFLDSAGNVGIGTANPTQKLDVVGAIQLSDNSGSDEAGTIRWTGTEFQAYNGTTWNTFGTTGGGASIWSQSGSDIYYNNGLVGIGTSSPSQDLHIEDTSSAIIRLHETETNGGDFELGAGSGGTGLFSIWDLNASASRLTIDSSGNVGIGTTSPSEKLHIMDNVDTKLKIESTLAGTQGATGLTLYNNVSDTPYYWNIQSLGGDGRFRIYDVAGASQGERFTIDQTGNVGIGTTSPGAKLHIRGTPGYPANSGTAFTGITRFGTGYYDTVLDVGQGDSGSYGLWLQAENQVNLAIHYPILLNPNGGNVGIGTIAPDTLLRLGTGYIGVNNLYGLRSRNAADSAWADLINMQADDSVRLYDSKVSITSAGNVGIGTTSPLADLHISGSDELRLGGTADVGYITIETYKGGSGAGRATFNAVDGTGTGDASYQFSVAGDVKFRILNNGNVGIGTTSPLRRFVVGDSYPGISLLDTSTGLGWVVYQNAASKNFMVSEYTNSGWTASQNYLSIQNGTGNVGIGTDSPESQLHVYNANQASIQLTDVSGSVNEEDIKLTNYNGQFIIQLMNSDASLRLNALSVDTTGHVGIGTTNPTSKLQVTGLPIYANNAAAIAGGLTAGAFYRTGGDPDLVCVVH